MYFKKIIATLLFLTVTVGCLVACGNDTTSSISNKDYNKTTSNKSSDTKEIENDRISIVTTIFPEYDWVREIMGDRFADADVTMLLDNGVDLHSYQPTTEDIMKITQCDLFIYVGGESDEWVEDVMKEATNPDMKVINLLEVLEGDVKEEEIVEGMEAEEEEEEGNEESKEEEIEYDEHVWLSLKNTQKICSVIAQTIEEIDLENADIYASNVEAYNEKLNALDEEYKKVTDEASIKTVLFGDRFPFRYLVDDYNLSYYAAFVGCSAESEASFDTILFLANKLDELNLSAIFTIEGSDQKIAEAIKNATSSKDQEILTIDSLQSTTAKDLEEGKTYLSTMTDNLEVLKQGLK